MDLVPEKKRSGAILRDDDGEQGEEGGGGKKTVVVSSSTPSASSLFLSSSSSSSSPATTGTLGEGGDIKFLLDGSPNGPRPTLECCAHVSPRLITTLLAKLPVAPALVLSIGCGQGFLEEALLRASQAELNLYGVEVETCPNKFLRGERLLRVPNTFALHADAILADAWMFIYPRSISLLERYLSVFVRGVLDSVIWLGPSEEFPEAQKVLLSSFDQLEIIGTPVLPGYETLAIATGRQGSG
jgi:hypothetical protein